MRNFKFYTMFQTVLLVFVFTAAYGQQAEKTLVKSFNLQGNQVVALQMDGPIEVATWDNNFLRVQMEVSLEQGSEALLKSLVRAGRYNLSHEVGEDSFQVKAPKMNHEVKIGGRPLEDKVSYKVFAPKDVLVKVPEKEQAVEGGASSSL